MLSSSVLRLSKIHFIPSLVLVKCHTQEEETRALVKSNGGLEPLVALIKNPENHGNKELMAAVTGALWKLSMSEDNVKCFQELELVPVLIGLLKDNSEGLDDLQFNQGKIQVLTNIVGAIGESARTHENRCRLQYKLTKNVFSKIFFFIRPGN